MSRPAPFSYLSPEQQNKWGTSENYMANWQDPMQSQFNQIKNDPNRGNPWLDANTNGLFGPGLMGGAPRELSNPDQPFVYDPGPRREALPVPPSGVEDADRNPIKPQELNSPTGGIMDLPFNNDSSSTNPLELTPEPQDSFKMFGQQMTGFGDRLGKLEEGIGKLLNQRQDNSSSTFEMGSNQPNYGYSPFGMGSNQPNYGYSPYNMLMGGLGSFGYGYG